jgi:hypothetical protein
MTKRQMELWKQESIEQAKLQLLEEHLGYMNALVRAAGEVH